MKEIYVEQIETYPDDIIGCVKECDAYLKKHFHSGIQKDGYYVQCALPNDLYWSDDVIRQLFHKFWAIAEKYYWVGYHVTRICSENEILQYGLIRLEFDIYWNRLSKVLERNNISESEIEYARTRIKKMYDGYLGERKERVCFFAPDNLLYKGKFNYFARNYGGEIAERSFENHEGMEKIWDVLTGMGTPVMVKFRFKLNDLYSFQNDDVFMEILRFITSKLFMNYDYPISIGQHIKKSIPPEDILEIQKIEVKEY